jgi:hypothetical protein
MVAARHLYPPAVVIGVAELVYIVGIMGISRQFTIRNRRKVNYMMSPREFLCRADGVEVADAAEEFENSVRG